MHIMTQHSTKKEREQEKYYCKYCDRVFFCSQYMIPHMNSKKHKDIIYAIENYNMTKLGLEFNLEDEKFQ